MIPPIALQRKPLVADEAPAPTTMHGSLAVMRNDMVAAGTRPNCPKGHAAAAGSRCDGAGGRAQDRTSATKRRGLQRHYRHGRWVPQRVLVSREGNGTVHLEAFGEVA